MHNKAILQKLLMGKDLTKEEMNSLVGASIQGTITQVRLAAFLTGLAIKGIIEEELEAAVNAVMKRAVTINPGISPILDTCGTGGDYISTFNISTTVAFVVAGAGLRVAKHGNRSMSSNCGSADVLEKLGVNIKLQPRKAERLIKEIGIAFLFAPLYHPCFKHVAKVRKELGFRTLFNFLGPLCNPAMVKRQVIGVYDPSLTNLIARVLDNLGTEHALVVHGKGMDEVSTIDETIVTELNNGEIKNYTLSARDFGFHCPERRDIMGSDANVNARIILDILRGKKGPKRDIVLLNAAAALYVGGAAPAIKEGIALAAESIDKGKALAKLRLLQERA